MHGVIYDSLPLSFPHGAPIGIQALAEMQIALRPGCTQPEGEEEPIAGSSARASPPDGKTMSARSLCVLKIPL